MNRLPPLIAVVDDEESVRRALQRLLRSAGFEVDVYSSGADFLDNVRSKTPACVVLDLHMPGVNGFDVQEALVNDLPSLPVVVITGYDTAETKARIAQHGARDYLRKPVDAMVLLASINAALGSGIRVAPKAADAKGKPSGDKK